MQQLSKDLLNHVEHRFVNIIGSADEEAVQICILMGSYFLFNGRPNAGLGILGSGIKIAQVLRLHRENLTAEPTDAFWETRRRSWWALEVFDKYAPELTRSWEWIANRGTILDTPPSHLAGLVA